MGQACLYYTRNSPYARITRVAARRSGLLPNIHEIEAKTRDSQSDFFNITPLARVPCLVVEQMRIADTRDICAYFDRLSGTMLWAPPENDQAQFLRHVAMGFLDGIAVWAREKYRADGEKSHSVMAYEAHRAVNILKWLEQHWSPRDASAFCNLTLCCAIEMAVSRRLDSDWHEHAPRVMRWVDDAAREADMRATRPTL